MVRLLAICLLLFPGFAWAAFSAHFDPDTLRISETTRLIVETDQEMQGDVDLSRVEKYFTVLNRATTQHVTILGSRQTIVQRLIVELEPKEVGSFSIGPIVQGDQRSEVLRVTVLPKAQGADDDTEIFIEAGVNHDQVHVQQQLVLTVKLFLGVNLLDGSLSDPAPPAARVDRMGEDKRYQTERNGRSFTVYERRYALFPQSSGTLEIPPLQFQGIAEDQNQGGQVFGSLFDQGRRIRASSSAISLDVAPPAATFSGRTWLPASQLQIDEVGEIVEQVEAGQPLTRRIQIQARGLTAEQLPEIDFGAVPGLRFYPDKPVRDTAVDGDAMVGVLQNSVAVIGAEPGVITLPEIRVDWWNTQTDQQESAVLPAREIRIAASSSASSVPPASLSASESQTVVEPEVLTNPTTDTSQLPVVGDAGNLSPARLWQIVALVMLLLWLLTIAGFILFRRLPRHSKAALQVHDDAGSGTADWRRRLRAACRDNDAAAARAALAGWLKACFGKHADAGVLHQVSGGSRLAELAWELDQQLYGAERNASGWSGQPLWDAFENLSASKTEEAQKTALVNLYPGSDAY